MRIIPAYAGSTRWRAFLPRAPQDHPRIRGEHANFWRWRAMRAGSSPHTRGARVGGARGHQECRIIPAYAGSTKESPRSRAAPRDHPRIRGEHALPPERPRLGLGSSPHTRGARSMSWKRRGCSRIIPAYAGSTEFPILKVTVGRDHPRIRGEHTRPQCIAPRAIRSSPHTRGAHAEMVDSFTGDGIIPAYAGSTCSRYRASPHPADHPRIRGEHSVHWASASSAIGSSPHTRGAPSRRSFAAGRMRIIPAYAGSTPREDSSRGFSYGSSPHTRGALTTSRLAIRWPRIIPAYAGSTSISCRWRPIRSNHPRIRGEHVEVLCWHQCYEGSSPHTRGALGFQWQIVGEAGIIPAYAGSTSCRLRRRPGSPDHPRIRGEHSRRRRAPIFALGSSPHTRGARDGSGVVLDAGRIIPAYAGSTTSRKESPPPGSDHPRIRGEHSKNDNWAIAGAGSSPHTRGALSGWNSGMPVAGIIPAYAGSTPR